MSLVQVELKDIDILTWYRRKTRTQQQQNKNLINIYNNDTPSDSSKLQSHTTSAVSTITAVVVAVFQMLQLLLLLLLLHQRPATTLLLPNSVSFLPFTLKKVQFHYHH
jgi:hypothetical protein